MHCFRSSLSYSDAFAHTPNPDRVLPEILLDARWLGKFVDSIARRSLSASFLEAIRVPKRSVIQERATSNQQHASSRLG